MSGEILWHKHHLVPRHVGGTDDPSNIIKVNTALHAFLHRQLYEEYGRWQDEIAYKALSGQIGREEAIRKAASKANKGKPMPDHVRQIISESNKRRSGNKHPRFGKKHTAAALEKMQETMFQEGHEPWNKGRQMTTEEVETNRQAQLNRPKLECPHCGRMISGGGNLKQHLRKHT